MPPTLKDFLDAKVKQYNQPSFIATDPICIPHLFKHKPDIEISGLFASIFAWGNRTTIIQKSRQLMELMDMAPHQFVTSHQDHDLKQVLHFKHRTFNTTDLLYFITFLKHHYANHVSLETAFTGRLVNNDEEKVPEYKVEHALNHFFKYFFSIEDAPARTKKHIASPAKNSTCKRLNMFLRWMVRRDHKGVDFGIWRTIAPRELICPVDVHVARVAKRFNLLERKQVDWIAALELTDKLKNMDSNDPVKYDFALFGLGVLEKF